MTADRMMAVAKVNQTLVDQFAIRAISTDRTTGAMNAAQEESANEVDSGTETYREPERYAREMSAASSMNLAMKRDWLGILDTGASYARSLRSR
jgi:hypothetical protein